MPLLVTILRRDIGGYRRIVDRLGDAGLLGGGQAADVDGQDDIGGRIGAFGANALFKALFGENDLAADAGLSREGVEHRLDQIGLPVGIDVDDVRLVGRSDGRRGEKGEWHKEKSTPGACFKGLQHCILQSNGFKAQTSKVRNRPVPPPTI